jgi:hypothetical protein
MSKVWLYVSAHLILLGVVLITWAIGLNLLNMSQDSFDCMMSKSACVLIYEREFPGDRVLEDEEE